MPFVVLHAVWFSVWIALRVEAFPFGLLTMLVQQEERQNEELLRISNEILELTRAIHELHNRGNTDTHPQ